MFKPLTVAIVAALFFASSPAGSAFPPLLPAAFPPLLPAAPPLPPPDFPCDDIINIHCWTNWFDGDTPCGTGDIETLVELRKKNPGMICPKPTYMEVRTPFDETPAKTGDVIYQSNPTDGFICLNADQPSGRECNNYRVRFVCHPPHCAGVCWTGWYDRDDPSLTGDWETLKDLRTENPGQICDQPLYIEAVTVEDEIPAINTGRVFTHYNPTTGFSCINKKQKNQLCLDYKVRFGCTCDT